MSLEQSDELEQQGQQQQQQEEVEVNQSANGVNVESATHPGSSEAALEANGGESSAAVVEATEESAADNNDCPQCELPNDPQGLHNHLSNLLTQSVAGSLLEFDAMKRHWQNFGANLPGFIATPYCSHCKLHFQGFLRYAAHCREAIDAAESEDAGAAEFASQHQSRFNNLVTFVCNFTDESVTAEDQKTLASSFLCPAGKPNYDMFQLKIDFVFTNKEAGAGGTTVDTEPPGQPLFACLVCQQPFRSLRRHLDDALWGCSTPIFRGRHNQIAESRIAHLHAWLGPESMQRLLNVFGSGVGGSGGGGGGDESNDASTEHSAAAIGANVKTPHCPVCGCHFSQPVSGSIGGGGGGCNRLLLHLQHDIDTPGHRELADQLRDRLLASDGPLQLTSTSEDTDASALIDWIGEHFACPHGGFDSNNGIVEQLRASLDRRRVEVAAGAGANSSSGAAIGAGVGGPGAKRPFPGGPGVGRKVARMSRGGGYPYQQSWGGYRRY